MVRKEEYPVKDNGFEYNGKTYDCHYAIERDIKMILQEAETSHKDTFDEFYDRNTLRPYKIRLYVSENTPIYGMIIYVIDYKKEQNSRSACGGYYGFEVGYSTLYPHPYQESICW